MGRYLTALNPALPSKVWLLQGGVLVNFFGNGLVAPFLVIYLHYGRGIPLGLAGSAVALGCVTAITSGLLAAVLADRFGPRNILVAAMTCNAAAYLLYTQVAEPWQAFAVGLLVGVGTGAYGPSSQSLIAALVPAESLPAAFAQNRMTSVVGLGLGAAVGGLIASRGLSGYLMLLVLDAATFIVFAALSVSLPPGHPRTRARSIGGGYRDVARDRAFRRLVGVNIVLVAAGIAPMLVLLPAFAKGQTHVSEVAIGVIYAVNTLVMVVTQMPITRLVRGRPRMQTLRLAALSWVGSWLVCLAAGAWLAGAKAAAVFAFAAGIYAVGECLYTAILLPTTIALAPSPLTGRYLGAMALAWQAGFMFGPSLGGAVLGVAPVAVPAICALGCLAAALGTLAVDRALAPELRRSPVVVTAA